MNPDAVAGQPAPKHRIARPSVLLGLGAGALAIGASGGQAACTAASKGTLASAASTISLGYLSVAFIPPVGGQRKASTGKSPFEMKVAGNALNKAVKIGANLEPTNA